MRILLSLYPNNRKSWEFDKEALEVEAGEANGETAKLKKFSDAGGPQIQGQPTRSKPNFSGCLGIALAVLLSCVPSYAAQLVKYKPVPEPEVYLINRISKRDKRYASFHLCLELLKERQAKNLVETGTSRSGIKGCRDDGCSTVIFADWAKNHNAMLTSIDISPCAIQQARQAVSPINPAVQFITQDSVSFLDSYDQVIDFLYLDSYDFDEKDPLPSQQHHLNEVMAAYPRLTQKTVIMIDDCGLPHGGKGAMAIDFLKNHGWKEVYSRYQSILIFSAETDISSGI